MKNRMARLILAGALGWGFLGGWTPVVRGQIEDSQLGTEEKAACIRNLKVIYQAIQKYQTDNKDLPNWLSDLVPQYLDDASVLICPVCKRTGDTEASTPGDPKISTSYDYDFCPAPLGKGEAPGDPTRTRRDWKRRQMGLVGAVVPLVRCRHHDVVLNLAYDGRVYESRGPWELLVTNQIDIADLSAARIFSGAPKTSGPRKLTKMALTFAPRDPAAKTNEIDLGTNYNAMLNEAWLGRPDNDLATLPVGLQTLGGVEYDVRGLIQLAGKGESAKRYPTSVTGIAVKQTCTRLHFLQAAAFGYGVDDGDKAGIYLVHFASNQVALEIPIVYGRDLRDWHTLANEKTNASEPTVVWSGTNKVSAVMHQQLRLFGFTWENPTPSAEIESIDFVSSQGKSVPFLIAITAEQ